MKVTIEKTFQGEKYWFYLWIGESINDITLRPYASHKSFRAAIADDGRYVDIDGEIVLKGYVNGIGTAPEKAFSRFKIPKRSVRDVLEEIEFLKKKEQ